MGLRHALRSLLHDKGFTITVVLTLAVCIAANTATFAVVHSVLLRPLPVPDSRSILIMANRYPKAGAEESYNSGAPDYYDRRRTLTVFQEQAMFNYTGLTLEIEGAPVRVRGMAVTPTLFPLLRVAPAWGRAFSDAEGEIGAEQKVILSDGLSRQLFGGPQAALGRDVRLSGRPFTVVGVMAADFNFVDPQVRLWVPLAFTPRQKEMRHSNNWYHIGRLKPGATVEQAQAQVDALNRANLDLFPQFKELLINAGFHTAVFPLEEMLIGQVRGALYLLWAGAGFVLLIGVLNIANLVLARTTLRRKEFATRLALGAGPMRLLRQLIAESMILALAGGAAGTALGTGMLAGLARNGLERLPRASEVRVDGVVIAVMLAAAAIAGIGIGLIPAVQVLRSRLNDVLREESRTGTGGRRARRVRQVLVVVQVGLAFVLLAGTGLLLASFRHLLRADPGFNATGVITAASNAPASLYSGDTELRGLMNRSLDAFRAIPSVVAAGATTSIPWGGSYSDSVILAEDYMMKPGESLISPNYVMATPGYFEAMNIPLIRGRYFTDEDRESSRPVIIVDEPLARHFWPGQDPIGRRMRLPQDANNLLKVDEHTRWLTVVGVVGAVRLKDMEGKGTPVGAYYMPYAQDPSRGFTFAIKTAGNPATVLPVIRVEFARLAPGVALFDVHTMTERSELVLASRRASLTLAVGFGALALFLSAIGIYGLLAYLVTQRQREIGIRMALGCSPGGVARLVFNEALTLLGAGLLLGAAGAAAMRSAVASQIYDVKPLDPVVMTAVVAAMVVVGLGACALPARRAVRVDPIIVLHEQ